MHEADLTHNEAELQAKLEEIFQLRRTRSKVNWDRGHFLKLLKEFGNPHLDLPPVIHVAGTNGKGSVIALLRSVLEAQGLRVHAYTSPHLVHVNERIYLAGQYIDNAYLHTLIDQALAYNQDAPLSFFEITTALAFKGFSQTPADILLLEVGMGGELDCTNVIEKPIATVVNRISSDHTEFLGDDIAGIARAKAGIMKGNVPCITAYQGQGDDAHVISNVLHDTARDVGAQLHQYGEGWSIDRVEGGVRLCCDGREDKVFPRPALTGAHQVYNAGVALMCLQAIEQYFSIDDNAVSRGFSSVQWDGRLQKVETSRYQDGVEVWLDSGHNDSAAEALSAQINVWTSEGKQVHLVVGMVGTKDPVKFLRPLIPYIDILHVVPIARESTSKTPEDIDVILKDQGAQVTLHAHTSALDALDAIAGDADNAIILVAGSVYLAGEVLSDIQGCD